MRKGKGVPAQQRFFTSTNPRRSVTFAPARLSSGDPKRSLDVQVNALFAYLSWLVETQALPSTVLSEKLLPTLDRRLTSAIGSQVDKRR